MFQPKLFSGHLLRLKRKIFANNKKRSRTPHLREVGRAFWSDFFILKSFLSSDRRSASRRLVAKGRLPPVHHVPAGQVNHRAPPEAVRHGRCPAPAQHKPTVRRARPPRALPGPRPQSTREAVRRALARRSVQSRIPIRPTCAEPSPGPLKPSEPRSDRNALRGLSSPSALRKAAPQKGRVFVKAARRFARGRSQSPASA